MPYLKLHNFLVKNSQPNYLKDIRKQSKHYIENNFEKNFTDYLVSSKKIKKLKYKIVNDLITIVSYFIYLDNEDIANFIKIFNNCYAKNSLIQKSYLFPKNLNSNDYIKEIKFIKDNYLFIFNKLLYKLFYLCNIQPDNDINKIIFYYIDNLWTISSKQTSFYGKHHPFLTSLIFKLMEYKPEFSSYNYKSKDFVDFVENFIKDIPKKNINKIIESDFLYRKTFYIEKNLSKIITNFDFLNVNTFVSVCVNDSDKLKILNNMNMFFNLFSEFLIHHIEIDKLKICNNIYCCKLFYSSRVNSMYCSRNCLNNKIQKDFRLHKIKKEEIFTSRRNYSLEQ